MKQAKIIMNATYAVRNDQFIVVTRYFSYEKGNVKGKLSDFRFSVFEEVLEFRIRIEKILQK